MVAERSNEELEIAIRDRVVFEGDVRGRLVSLPSLVVRVAEEELWLGLPEPEPSLLLFRVEQPVRLMLNEDGGTRLGRSVFLRTLAGDPPRIVAVSRPAAFELLQRRQHSRYELDAPIRFRQLDPLTKEPRGRSATASTVNVSLGGILMRTPVPVSVGDEVDVTLPLGGGNHISAGNRVVRVRVLPTANIPGQPLVMEVGTRFTRITSADQDLLLRMALAADRRRRLSAEASGSFA